ncbi:hypothetical protein CANCADRAFT_44406 [Tortispora caseinolytica NRRL Y-17796]|uniref:DNA-directed RNA polymerase III subunit RPC4 n=1 Tax=Tortispora caseinolytica NRRL Y-17796 TaxID=767744 RepID=A0A1E4TGC1_9ASCO|nr:hypothetical protein CANCADRAFT_44406 [Tortispora caseinolytica NRRL Y-17796]
MDKSSRLDSLDKVDSKNAGGAGLKFKPKIIPRRLKSERDASAPPPSVEPIRAQSAQHTNKNDRNNRLRKQVGTRINPVSGPFGGAPKEVAPSHTSRSFQARSKTLFEPRIKTEDDDVIMEDVKPVKSRIKVERDIDDSDEETDKRGLIIKGNKNITSQTLFPTIPGEYDADSTQSIADQFMPDADNQVALDRKLFSFQIPRPVLAVMLDEKEVSDTVKEEESSGYGQKMVGKLRIHKSGNVTMELNDGKVLEVSSGMNPSFMESLAVVNVSGDDDDVINAKDEDGNSVSGDMYMLGNTSAKIVATGIP